MFSAVFIGMGRQAWPFCCWCQRGHLIGWPKAGAQVSWFLSLKARQVSVEQVWPAALRGVCKRLLKPVTCVSV